VIIAPEITTTLSRFFSSRGSCFLVKSTCSSSIRKFPVTPISRLTELPDLAEQHFDEVMEVLCIGGFFEEFFVHLPTKNVHIIFATLLDLEKGVVFVKDLLSSDETPRPYPIFKEKCNLQTLLNSSPKQLYEEQFPVQPIVLYEVYMQRQFVPQSYWKYYPEVEKPNPVDEEELVEQQEIEMVRMKLEMDSLEEKRNREKESETREVAREVTGFFQEVIATSKLSREDLLERINKRKQEQKEKKKDLPQLNAVSLHDNRVAVLQEFLRNNNGKVSGSKAELMNRVRSILFTTELKRQD